MTKINSLSERSRNNNSWSSQKARVGFELLSITSHVGQLHVPAHSTSLLLCLTLICLGLVFAAFYLVRCQVYKTAPLLDFSFCV